MSSINEKYAEVSYNPNLDAVVLRWREYATPKQYKNTLEFTFELLQAQKCKNLVEDMILGKEVPSDVVKWVRNDYVPMLAKSGVRKIAVLLEGNVARKQYIEDIKESIQMSGMQMHCFKSQKELEKWVQNMPNKDIIVAEKGTFKHYF